MFDIITGVLIGIRPVRNRGPLVGGIWRRGGTGRTVGKLGEESRAGQPKRSRERRQSGVVDVDSSLGAGGALACWVTPGGSRRIYRAEAWQDP
jgi:hypothetical protein